MKTLLSLALVGALACTSPAAEIKIATVDLQKLMSEYYKAQSAFKALKEKEVSFAKELDRLRLEGRQLAKETEDLRELAANNALSPSERQEKKKNFETKLTDFRAFEIRYDDLRAQAQAELQNTLTITQKRILDDVLSATKRIGETEGFNLVLNASKANPATSDVLFSRNIDDITERVLASLNATKPIAPEGNLKSK
jgi:outer membrane protein